MTHYLRKITRSSLARLLAALTTGPAEVSFLPSSTAETPSSAACRATSPETFVRERTDAPRQHAWIATALATFRRRRRVAKRWRSTAARISSSGPPRLGTRSSPSSMPTRPGASCATAVPSGLPAVRTSRCSVLTSCARIRCWCRSTSRMTRYCPAPAGPDAGAPPVAPFVKMMIDDRGAP